MLQLTRLRVLLMLVLAVTSSSLLVWHFTSATPSPSVGQVVTPGNVGPCNLFISLDGTTPVSHTMIQTTIGGTTYLPGDNFVGTAGEGIDAFLLATIASNELVCFSGQTFPMKGTLTLANFNGVTFSGVEGKTVIQQAAGTNVVQTMFIIQQGSTNIVFEGITFDFNRANNPGSPAYTCPNGGWILQLGNAVFATPSRVLLTHDEFENAACQVIEGQMQDLVVQNSYFHDSNECCFITGIQSQRVIVSGNLITKMDTTGPDAAVSIENSGQNITFVNNIIQSSGSAQNGIELNAGNYTTIGNNVISGFAIGIRIDTQSHVVTVTGNSISDCNLNGIYVHAAGAGSDIGAITIVGNSLRNTGKNSQFNSPILVTNNARDITIVGNTVLDGRSGSSRAQIGIYVTGSSNETIISNNVVDNINGQGIRIENAFFSTVSDNIVRNTAGNAILITGTSNQIIVVNNQVSEATGSISVNSSGNNVVTGNYNYNPVGKVTNFIVGSFLGICGTGTTVVASTDYVVCDTDVYLTSSAGTGVSITIKDASGNTIYAPGATLAVPFLIHRGEKVNFGAFSVAPTVTVWAN